MATHTFENVGKHNKFGFCKFQETCRFKHVKEICQEKSCEIETCSQIHPKECRYYKEYTRCKFGSYCFFRHEDKPRVNIQKFEEKINTFEEEQTKLQAQINCLNQVMNEKVCAIKHLEKKLNTLEKAAHLHEEMTKLSTSDDHFKQLDKKVKEVAQNNFILVHSVDDLERCMKSLQNQMELLLKQYKHYSCTLCGKVFQNEVAWRSHIRSEHKT